ncbi:MAG: hypothetical protein Tsb0032_17270 [Kiloniellaceae bacterium]
MSQAQEASPKHRGGAGGDIQAYLNDYEKHGYCLVPGLIEAESLAGINRLTQEVLARAAQLEASDDIYDLEPSHRPGAPRVRRIRRPHDVDPAYRALAAHPGILKIVSALIGPHVRLNHSKINLKSPKFGSPVEWHQDWAFIPHTNPDLVIVAIMLDDCTTENGPMLMMPGSHRGPLYSHHAGEKFVGAIDVAGEQLDVEGDSRPVLGPAGSVSFHHPWTIHGSALNRSGEARSLLFFEYAAADAWPLFYGVDYQEFDSRMIAGEATHTPRLEEVFVRMPYPVATAGAIYSIQEGLEKKYFETYSGDAAAPGEGEA